MSRKDEKCLSILRDRYAKANRQEQSAILDDFVKTMGYHCKYPIALLNGTRTS